ncbi:MAG: hypothetical protein JWM80_2294 [Cyanobacteria bacterium RYN_339]|nr:hypothetical protein [Cyanobacteria bacterium RYN_339]
MTETATLRPTVGPYALSHELGEGAFARVYSAEAPEDGRLVVLKVGKDKSALERFRREYEVGSLLLHPHLAQVLDYGDDPAAGPYLVMEYYDGHPIYQRAYPEQEIVRVGLQLARALTALVPHGLVHRDLTPANVLVDEHGLVRLIDFGLMSDPEAATAAGTPLYMAPEALEGRPTDARADLYSLGALLYRMACGYAPFEGLGQAELLQAVVGEAPEPIAQRVPELSPALAALIMRLLAKAAADRPASAAEVATALARLDPEVARTLPLGNGTWSPASAWEAWAEEDVPPGVNIFVGTPGLGRTRALLEAQRHLRRHYCQALYVPADEAMTPYELVERIWRWASAHAPTALDGIMPEDASAIAALWPWAFPDAPPAPEGAQIAKPLRNALATLLSAAGGNRLAILIDDWNTADASSRAVLAGGWKRELAGFHWLLGGPEEVQGALNWTLEPLPADKMEGWLDGVLHGAPPRGLAARLWTAGDGQPGWMVQALRHLVATGELDDPEAWNDVELAIPSTLEPLLEAQWNRLTPDQRAMGEVLGIHGGPIGHAELEALAELLPTSWQLELTALVARDLLVMQAGAYRFSNGVWPRWIRERTSTVRRQHVAVTVGRALERLWFPSPDAEREPRLIYRLAALYEQGDQAPPTIRMMLEAGQMAARIFANAEAVSYFERGLQAVKQHPTPDRVQGEALKLRIGLADALRTMGEGEGALRQYQKILEGPLRAAIRGRLMVSLGKCHQMVGASQAARTAFEEAVQLLTPLDDVDERLRAMISLGRAYHFAGEHALCMEMYRRALDQATLHERDEYRADALSFLGNRMANAPETASEGLELLQQALELRESLTNRIAANDTHMLLGNALLSLGRYREAKQHFTYNLELARSFQSWQDEGYARVNLALCEAEQGHWPVVLEHLEECLRLGALVKDNVLISVARLAEAQARMHVGDFEQARRSLEAGKALEEALGSADVRVIALLYEAELQLHWGAFEAARQETERALDLISQGAGAEHATHAGLLNAEAYMHLGKLESAEERLANVEAQVERAGSVGPRAHIRRVAGWLAWRQARPDHAKRHWEEGLAIAEAEGLEHLEARLRLSLYLVERQQLGALPDMASLERACELAEKRRTPEVLALGCLALALVLRKADHQQPAERMARRGRELLGLLTQALPNPMARDAFMGHPERTPFCEVGDAERIELLERRSRRLEMLLALVRELAAQRDARKVVEMARDFTLEVTRAERVLVLLNPGRGDLEPFDGSTEQYSRSIVTRVATERQAICVLDTLMDEKLNLQGSLLDLQVRAVMCVPLVIDRTLHGVIYVDSRVAMGAFTEEDLEIVQAIGMQTAVALDNARMYAILQAQLAKKNQP